MIDELVKWLKYKVASEPNSEGINAYSNVLDKIKGLQATKPSDKEIRDETDGIVYCMGYPVDLTPTVLSVPVPTIGKFYTNDTEATDYTMD